MKSLNKYRNYIEAGIILIALFGITFPLVNITLHLIGTITINFRLTDIFRNSHGDFLNDTFYLTTGDHPLSGVGLHIIVPFAAYILAIILLVVTLALTFTKKFKTLKIAFVLTATTLMIYAGIRIIAMPDTLIYYLEEILADFIGEFAGFLTTMVDFSNTLEVNLGLGYWLTLIALLNLSIFLIVTRIIEYIQKKGSD